MWPSAKKGSLPSAGPWHSAKALFAECQGRHSAKNFFFKFDGMGGLGRQVPFFLPSATLCRVLHSTKRAFAECRPLPSAGNSVALGKATLCQVPPGPALGKEWLRRVTNFWRSTKLAASSKSAFSVVKGTYEQRPGHGQSLKSQLDALRRIELSFGSP